MIKGEICDNEVDLRKISFRRRKPYIVESIRIEQIEE